MTEKYFKESNAPEEMETFMAWVLDKVKEVIKVDRVLIIGFNPNERILISGDWGPEILFRLTSNIKSLSHYLACERGLRNVREYFKDNPEELANQLMELLK